ncbi:MAG: hypothetical protein ACHP9Z_32160, partial [Streptosporangiales bacterium]
ERALARTDQDSHTAHQHSFRRGRDAVTPPVRPGHIRPGHILPGHILPGLMAALPEVSQAADRLTTAGRRTHRSPFLLASQASAAR